MLYRLYPMIWYNCRMQEHNTVYGITPAPPAGTWLSSNVRCDSAEHQDPLYVNNRTYTQILYHGQPVTWNQLTEWLNDAMGQGFSLQGVEMPRPNVTFYISG
jgi:hypothetical protein